MSCKHCHGDHDVELHAKQKAEHDAGLRCERCGERERDEHLRWAKARALEYLPAYPAQAVASMSSDLMKHHAWRDPIAMALCFDAYRHAGSARAARAWIDGWH